MLIRRFYSPPAAVAAGLLLLASAGLNHAAWAQDVEPAHASASEDLMTLQLAPIVVTARRTEESVLSVPISMVVLDGEHLAEAGLTTVTDLPERVPGFVVTVSTPRLTTFAIRGLGSNPFNDGVESSVGLFMDGVYLARPGFAIFDLVDIERIEILRGPQGSLFGKNTTAGAVHILTRRPSHDFSAQMELAGGDYGSQIARGSVTGSLIEDELAGRLTAYASRRDGLITNLFDGRDLNERNKHGLRGQLQWTPSEDQVGRLIAEFGQADERCCAYPLVAPVRPSVTASDEYMEYQRVSPNPYDRLADSDSPTHIDVEQRGLSFEWNQRMDEQRSWTSVSAFRDWRFQPMNDDATSLKLVTGGTANTQRQFSQELRLHTESERADLVLGLFGLHQEIDGQELGMLGEDLAPWVFGGLLRQQVPFATRSNSGLLLDAVFPPQTLDGIRVDTRYRQQSSSLAGFGSVNWQLQPRLTLSLGLRYTLERKEAEVQRTRTGGDLNASPLSLTNNLEPLGELIGLDLSGFTFGQLIDDVVGGEFARADTRHEGELSGNAALSYALANDVNTYASVSRGYKSGGINLGVTSEAIKPTFDPEFATSYELGLKAGLLDRRVQLSAAVYHTEVRDYQALTFDEDVTLIPNPRLTNLLNVGAVQLRGVELETLALLRGGWSLRASAAFNRAVTTDFRNAPDEVERANTKDLSGRQLYNAPIWTTSVGLEHQRALSAQLDLYGGLDYLFRTDTYGTVERGRSSYIDGYELTNARIGLRRSDQRWDLGLAVRNVFDEHYVAAVQALYGVGDYGAFAGDPRTYLVTLRVSLS